jgi:hypothetical protein
MTQKPVLLVEVGEWVCAQAKKVCEVVLAKRGVQVSSECEWESDRNVHFPPLYVLSADAWPA